MAPPQVRQIIRQSKTDLSGALSEAWGRVSHKLGKAAFAEAVGCDLVTLNRALAGPSLPTAQHLLNSLVADTTALSEVLSLYGLKVSPAVADPANDFDLAAELGHTVGEMIDRLRHRKRSHVDTKILADKFRELIPHMQAIVDEDERRGS